MSHCSLLNKWGTDAVERYHYHLLTAMNDFVKKVPFVCQFFYRKLKVICEDGISVQPSLYHVIITHLAWMDYWMGFTGEVRGPLGPEPLHGESAWRDCFIYICVYCIWMSQSSLRRNKTTTKKLKQPQCHVTLERKKKTDMSFVKFMNSMLVYVVQ